MKISIVGAGYVGVAIAILISKKYKVSLLDIDEEKVFKINNKMSPFEEKEIKYHIEKEKLKLTAGTSKKDCYSEADLVIICTPTNFDDKKKSFDTKSVEDVVKDVLKVNEDIPIVIKSTIPVGFTEHLKNKYKTENIFFSPEFLRETNALFDCLNPSRIIIGDKSKFSENFVKILCECSDLKADNIPILYMSSNEAEAVKLFSNTYLAMRVAFFNELDSFSESNNLSTKTIIEGIGHDPRIGNFYNNPSFGYGGYCLPKDSKQLLNLYSNVPNKIINAIVESNRTRKEFIAKSILEKKPKVLGIYRLVMKKNSDNIRESAIFDIINLLKKENLEIVVFEPQNIQIKKDEFKIIKSIEEFKNISDLIIANRFSSELKDVKEKVYTRDIFNIN